MLGVLRLRDYRLLAAGTLTSSLGDWLLLIAVPFHVLHLTGSALATSTAVAAEYVPALLLGPFAGVFADRWDRRRTMLTCDVARGAVVATMLLVRDGGQVWILYAALLGEATLSQFFGPARSALVPALVGRGDELQAAKTLAALIGGTVRLVGGPLGGALYAAAGFSVVVGVDVNAMRYRRGQWRQSDIDRWAGWLRDRKLRSRPRPPSARRKASQTTTFACGHSPFSSLASSPSSVTASSTSAAHRACRSC